MLTFDRDETITVTVCGDRLVKFNGKEQSLNSVTKELLEGKHLARRLIMLWRYNGRPLLDIYNETYGPREISDQDE